MDFMRSCITVSLRDDKKEDSPACAVCGPVILRHIVLTKCGLKILQSYAIVKKISTDILSVMSRLIANDSNKKESKKLLKY